MNHLKSQATACAALLGCAAALSTPLRADAPASTPAANPAPEKFGAAVTFYASFDAGAPADLSNGDAKPRDPKLQVELKPGVWGQAFLSGEKTIAYSAEKNVDLSKPGALAVWISPYQWKREEGADPGYIFFTNVLDQGRQLMLARMGNKLNKEAVYAYGKAGDTGKSVARGNSRDWKNGEWHLLVANWSNAAIEFSLDGGALGRAELSTFEKAEGKPGLLIVGSKSGENAQYLVDELMVLNRPLGQDEIKWLWSTKPKVDEDTDVKK
jgi:hypothetical protein